jgi:hypothetical protein
MKLDAKLSLLYCFFFLAILSSCQKESKDVISKISPDQKLGNGHQPLEPGFADNSMVLYWNEKVATVLSAPMNQPTRARLFAIMEIAVHDALNNIKPKYERFALLNNREQFASPDAAVASAAYWVIKGLNRQGNFPVDTWYNESLATVTDGESKELGKVLGKKAADAIIANRLNDGFSQVIVTSTTPADGTDPGKYRSTLRYVGGVLTLSPIKNIPNWGNVLKPFVTENNYQFRPAGPYVVNSSQYTNDYNETKSKGAKAGSTRTSQEETLARFWSENRPSLIWNNFARNIIATKKMDAWKTARLFALMHTAMADGINTVMESKYYFYSWRPETGIRLGNNDGNNQTTGEATWLPFLEEVPNTFPSPPVPEYPSGFAMYGGTATKVLSTLLETDQVSVNLTSAFLPGTTLHYSSISQAATDNSLAKIYSGWYFRKAVVDGEQMGKDLAQYIIQHHFRSSE